MFQSIKGLIKLADIVKELNTFKTEFTIQEGTFDIYLVNNKVHVGSIGKKDSDSFKSCDAVVVRLQQEALQLPRQST
ncbi:hypothetical protein Tco_1452408 [Tanacetum coccineum]